MRQSLKMSLLLRLRITIHLTILQYFESITEDVSEAICKII